LEVKAFIGEDARAHADKQRQVTKVFSCQGDPDSVGGQRVSNTEKADRAGGKK
jgi:hypothetical protein